MKLNDVFTYLQCPHCMKCISVYLLENVLQHYNCSQCSKGFKAHIKLITVKQVEVFDENGPHYSEAK